MPNLASSKKALRVSERKNKTNARVRESYRAARKDFLKSVTAGDAKEADTKLAVAYSKIDMAAKKKVIHKNTASRYKSRLAARLNKTVAKS